MVGCCLRRLLLVGGNVIRRSINQIQYQAFHSKPTLTDHNNMEVELIPMLKDNYGFLIIDKATGKGAVVDPVEPDTVLNFIKNKCEVSQVLTTHHHWDHAGGNAELNKKKTGMTFYGGDDRIGALNHKVKHEETFLIGSLKVTCYETPCHTKGHVCYLVEGDNVDPAVFTGDTLFTAGCGRFFEGTAPQMYRNLLEILGELPGKTRVYCGHEYALQNLKFAKHVEPDNPDVLAMIKDSEAKRAAGKPTVPTTIDQEKLYNPFMRVKENSVKKFAKLDDPVEVMGFLRKIKDTF